LAWAGCGSGVSAKRWFWPNPAFSGRGCTARQPWRFSGKGALPAVLLDGYAAPLTQSLGAGEEAEKAVVKLQAAGESEYAARPEQKARSPAGKGEAG